MLKGKDRVGLPEIAKLLSPQFNQAGGMNASSNTEDNKYQMGSGKAKGKKKKQDAVPAYLLPGREELNLLNGYNTIQIVVCCI